MDERRGSQQRVQSIVKCLWLRMIMSVTPPHPLQRAAKFESVGGGIGLICISSARRRASGGVSAPASRWYLPATAAGGSKDLPALTDFRGIRFCRSCKGVVNYTRSGSFILKIILSESIEAAPSHTHSALFLFVEAEIEGAGLHEGAVANRVEIGRRVFGRDNAIRSSGEVNGLIGWSLRQGLPSIDFTHGDLA